MKKLVVAMVFTALLVCVLVTSIFAVSMDAKVELATGQQLESVNSNFFLPSSADIKSVKINFNAEVGSVTYGDGVALANGGAIDLTPFKTEDKYHNECYKVEFTVGSSKETYTFYAANSLPAVFIDTSIGIDSFKIKQQKDEFAKVSILNKDGSYEYKDTEIGVSEAKVRGNTTPDLYKKPYQIKLEAKTDLYGMGEAKTWILLANYLDQSYIRNATMFELAKELGMNASSFVSVDVYVDGYYEGVYLLCEKVQVQSQRVNIRDLEKEMKALMGTDYGRGGTTIVNSGATVDDTYLAKYKYYNSVITPEDITGGYLIELDNSNWDAANKNTLEECWFSTDSGNLYVIKSPEVCSQAQMEYIATLFADMEEAFTSPNGKNSKGKHYSEYMDVDSFAYAYIMAEFGRTYDCGSNSVYFYKDADKDGQVSKFVKGPLWDCDNSLANIVRGNAHLTDNMWASTRTPWNKLTQHADFNAVVTEKFEGIYDTIYDMVDAGGFIDKQIAEIGSSVAMDRIRNHLNTKDLWPINTYKDFKGTHYEANTSMIHWFNRPQISESEWAFPTYVVYSDGLDTDATTVIGNIRTHMVARADWLALQWNCDVDMRDRVDHVYDNDEDATCNECDFVRKVSDHEFETPCGETCKECGYKRIPHVYDNTCDATCNECGAAREESALHVYDHGCDNKCNLCGKERTIQGHKYDNDCDASCNGCGAKRTVPDHVYDNDCDKDCNKCGFARDVEGHTGGEATCRKKAICTKCGLAYGELAAHTYGEEWVSDGSFHWKQCTMCQLAKSERARLTQSEEYSSDAETHFKTCTVCNQPVGSTSEAHTVGEGFSFDETHHFKTCTVCNAKVGKAEHKWDEGTVTKEATKKEAGVKTYTCSDCGKTKTEEIPVLPSGCGGGGEGTLAAFITSGTILLVWFVFKKKIFNS